MNTQWLLLMFSIIATESISLADQNIHLIDSCCLTHNIQPFIKNGYFFNNQSENKCKHIFDAAKIFLATKTSFKKYFTVNSATWIQHDPVLQSSEAPQLQWIGHASFLIQINEFNILTDPIFYDLNPILYPRKTPAGIKPNQLPQINFVIISHNHRDHLDETSMEILKSHQPIMLVPIGTQCWFTTRGFTNVIEHSWWQSTKFNRNGRTIEFTFVPAVHWSGRGPLDVHTSLWGGWIIKTDNKTVYFAGDTGFDKTIFKAIADYAKTIDCALLPIGPCEPRELMYHSHMGPEDAVEAYKILNPQLFVPMHWGTFRLGPDPFDCPIKRLNAAWEAMVDTQFQNKLYKIKFGERIGF